MDADWLLRIEDIDTERSKAEFIEAIYEDLHWLGLKWPEPVLLQSTRMNAYAKAGEKLQKMGLLYPCFCSRREIKQNATGLVDPDGAPVYPRTCKNLSPETIREKRAGNMSVQYRLDMDKALAMAGPLSFTLAQPTPWNRPKISFANPARWGDVVIQRKNMPTSYHLSVVVDDAAQNITHVTRGRDMQAATDIHVLLQFLLGLPSPLYSFHRLILDEKDNKLSKSKYSKSLRVLRREGATPQDIRIQLGLAR